MADTGYVDRNRFQYESKLLQSDRGNQQQYLRQKIENQINQRLQSPPERDREAYRSPPHEDKPRLLSPSSVQDRLISNGYNSNGFIKKNQPLNQSKESFSKPPLYQSPTRREEVSPKNGGLEQKAFLTSDLGKAQREQRRREIMGKINELNEKLNQEANSRLTIEQSLYSSPNNQNIMNNANSNSSQIGSRSSQLERQGSQNSNLSQQGQFYSDKNTEFISSNQRAQVQTQPQSSYNNNIPYTNTGYSQQNNATEGLNYPEVVSKNGVENSRRLSGDKFKYIPEANKYSKDQASKYSVDETKSIGDKDISYQSTKNYTKNGINKNHDEKIQLPKEIVKQTDGQYQKSVKSETSPRSDVLNETVKLKQEISKLQTTNSSLQSDIDRLKKSQQEIEQSLKEQLKASQDELAQVKQIQQKQEKDFKLKMEEGERKMEINEMEMQAAQQALQEQMEDMENAMNTIKRSYEEKLQEETRKQVDLKISREAEILLQRKDDIIRELTQNNELKDMEVKKMEELIGKFKDLFEQIKEEKEVLLSDNDNLMAELNQYKQYFAKLFAENKGQEEEANQDEENYEEQEDYEEDADQEYEQDQNLRENGAQEEQENHLTGEHVEGEDEDENEYEMNQEEKQHEQEGYEDNQNYEGEENQYEEEEDQQHDENSDPKQ